MSYDTLPDCETCGGERCLDCGYGCKCDPCSCDAPEPPVTSPKIPHQAITAAAETMPGLTREHALQVAMEALEAAGPHIRADERERIAQFIEHEANRDSETPAAAWSWLVVHLRQEQP